ncbi:hypothetical protein Maq22A_2p41150 (plasmid) [Methylobacterium aquaticum]|uniref:Uncharacterized protein n=1 Tax=Methylobacterium aquaticum TaxID=270351 RepID=A0A0C6FNS5_9HYPH|nr:hypothetical protein Maq22A_2p41150 [Methylobacterium aquaticum]
MPTRLPTTGMYQEKIENAPDERQIEADGERVEARRHSREQAREGADAEILADLLGDRLD